MNREPLVSVIIPTYNHGRFVRQAIDSALDQTYPAVEVIVVDDGSTDGSGAMLDEIEARDRRIRVVHKVNAGLSAARNTGIALARGAYINFLDSDDWLLPDKLSRQVAALEARPDVDLVFSDIAYVDDADTETVIDMGTGGPPAPFPDVLVYRNWFGPMVPLLRRRLVERVGGFDEAFRAAEDWDYWYRCAQHTPFLYLPGKVAMYRLHGEQMTRDDDRMATANLQFAAKHFANDRRKRRSNLAAFHLARARKFKKAGDMPRCALHLARFASLVNSIKEARLIWSF